MKAELIIFDLDGTLVNSIPDLTNAINHVAINFSLPQYSESSVGELVGGGIPQLLEKAFDISSDDIDFAKYYKQFMDYYSKNHSNSSHLFDNVVEVLEHFKSKKLAVLSNKLHQFSKKMVEDYGIDTYFDIVLGATDDLKKKPSSEPIVYLMQKLNVTPESTIIVGDSEPDILTAKNSGISSVAVTYGYRSRPQLELHKPDFIIDKLSDLITIIE